MPQRNGFRCGNAPETGDRITDSEKKYDDTQATELLARTVFLQLFNLPFEFAQSAED
jgi:hypothetical protein